MTEDEVAAYTAAYGPHSHHHPLSAPRHVGGRCVECGGRYTHRYACAVCETCGRMTTCDCRECIKLEDTNRGD